MEYLKHLDAVVTSVIEFLIVSAILATVIQLVIPYDTHSNEAMSVHVLITLPCSLWIAWRSLKLKMKKFKSDL